MASRCHHALKKPVFDTLHTVHIHDVHIHDVHTHDTYTHARACACIIFCYASLRLRFYFRDVFAKRRFSISLSLFFSLCSSSHLVIVTHAVNISFSSFLRFYPSICFSLLLYNSFSQVVFPDEPRKQIWSTSENLKKKHSKKHSSRHRK